MLLAFRSAAVLPDSFIPSLEFYKGGCCFSFGVVIDLRNSYFELSFSELRKSLLPKNLG